MANDTLDEQCSCPMECDSITYSFNVVSTPFNEKGLCSGQQKNPNPLMSEFYKKPFPKIFVRKLKKMTKKNNIEELKKVRKKIDNIDNKIIELIGDRFKEIHKVTKLKENREEIIDHERITHILKSVQSKAKKNKIDAEIIVRIWQIFIQEAIKLESAKIKK